MNILKTTIKNYNFATFVFLNLLSILLFGCAPESKYVGGNGAFRSYESLGDYNNNRVRYHSIESPDSLTQDSYIPNTSSKQPYQITQKNTSNQNKVKSNDYQAPVSGQSHFTPTQSLLGGMRDSEAIQRATMKPYRVGGKTYYPHPVKVGDVFDGVASWYGPDFHTRSTSNGETYNMYAHTAANKTLPMNTIVKVYNKDNGKTTIVRINDRGPFVQGRIIDLSNIAARDIEMVGKGVANVRIEVVGFGADYAKNNTKDSLSNNNNNKQQSNPKSYQSNVAITEQTSQQFNTLTPSAQQNTFPNNATNNPKNSLQQYRENAIPHTTNNQTMQNAMTNQYIQSSTAIPSSQSQQNNNIDKKENQNIVESNMPQAQNQATTQNTNPQSIVNDRQSNTLQNTPLQANSESNMQDQSLSQNIDSIEEDLPDAPKQEEKKSVEENVNTEPKQNQALLEATQKLEQQIAKNQKINKDLDDSLAQLKNATKDLQNQNTPQQTTPQPNTMQQSNNVIQKPQQAPIKDSVIPQQTNSQSKAMGNFMVSLNVFSQEDRAKHFLQESQEVIKNTNYEVGIVKTDKGLYRVAVRGFLTHDEAKKFIETHNLKSHIVAEDK